MKEPVFGPNAKAFLTQAAIGVAVMLLLKFVGFGDFVYWLSCTYVTGSCA